MPCAYCGENLKYRDITIDHITPRKRGGTNHAANLTVACRTCNRIKGAEPPLHQPSYTLDSLTEHLRRDARIRKHRGQPIEMPSDDDVIYTLEMNRLRKAWGIDA
jgi:hypothetical protein